MITDAGHGHESIDSDLIKRSTLLSRGYLSLLDSLAHSAIDIVIRLSAEFSRAAVLSVLTQDTSTVQNST